MKKRSGPSGPPTRPANTGSIPNRSWNTDGILKGVVLIVHGLNSHSGYYQDFAAQLNGNDYEVYAIDFSGRGLSEGERYYILHFIFLHPGLPFTNEIL